MPQWLAKCQRGWESQTLLVGIALDSWTGSKVGWLHWSKFPGANMWLWLQLYPLGSKEDRACARETDLNHQCVECIAPVDSPCSKTNLFLEVSWKFKCHSSELSQAAKRLEFYIVVWGWVMMTDESLRFGGVVWFPGCPSRFWVCISVSVYCHTEEILVEIFKMEYFCNIVRHNLFVQIYLEDLYNWVNKNISAAVFCL